MGCKPWEIPVAYPDEPCPYPPETAAYTKAALGQCRLRCPVCPKADATRRSMSTRSLPVTPCAQAGATVPRPPSPRVPRVPALVMAVAGSLANPNTDPRHRAGLQAWALVRGLTTTKRRRQLALARPQPHWALTRTPAASCLPTARSWHGRTNIWRRSTNPAWGSKTTKRRNARVTTRLRC
jgi:hypothetical protein